MQYTEFKKRVMNEITPALPINLRECELKLEAVDKLGSTYDGLIIIRKDTNVRPVANLNQFYKCIERGDCFEDVMEKIVDTLTMTPPTPVTDSAWIANYECAKDKLFIRLSNAERNKKIIDRSPHKIIGDLALTVHILVSTNGGMSCGLVDNDLLKHYGITEDELFYDAMISSPEVLPLDIIAIADLGFEDMLAVTNKQKLNGASAIFYTGVLDKLAERLGGNLIILPSSIHETIVIPDMGNYSELIEIVKAVNGDTVAPSEQLSNNIYRYDAVSHEIEMIEEE